MATPLPLKSMTREEKLRTMEALWVDLSQDEDRLKSPDWHEKALKDAKSAVEAGRAGFDDWDKAKKRIRRRTSKHE